MTEVAISGRFYMESDWVVEILHSSSPDKRIATVQPDPEAYERCVNMLMLANEAALREKDIPTTRLYFECHITIDPVFDERRKFAEIAAPKFGFKLAKLLMDKGNGIEQSKMDTFMTGHDVNFEQLKEKMTRMIKWLQENNYVVRRYKIENTLIDSRNEKDPLGLLATEPE